jgi:4-hydroxybenzoate polyprenyltransferase
MKSSASAAGYPLPRSRLRAFLQLMRPANVVTAWADILAGSAAAAAAVAALPLLSDVGWLLLATTGLYAGGVALNDVCDARLDAVERPERPIPSGQVSRLSASALAAALLVLGVLCAWQVSATSGWLAIAVALAVIFYDTFSKHSAVLGPLNMALCRGGNLLLGISIAPAVPAELGLLALIPLVYIAAITVVSRGEVQGGTAAVGYLAVALMASVLVGLLALTILPAYQWWSALPFVLLLASRVLPPFVRAGRDPQPANVRQAVKAGVLSVIVVDAALAGGFGGLLVGFAVLLLWPLSLGLGRVFAVT